MTISKSISSIRLKKNLTIDDKFANAKAKLMLTDGFTGQMLSYLKVVHDNRVTPTMATDGHSLYYNDKFINTLTKKDLIYVLAHEAWHVMLKHQLRAKKRKRETYNQAADYAVNLIIDSKYKHSKALEPLLDYKYESMNVEEIYNDLMQDNKAPDNQQASQGQSGQSNESTDTQEQSDESSGNTGQSDESSGAPEQSDEQFNYDEPISKFGDVLPAPKQDKSLSAQDDLAQQEEKINRQMHQAYISAGQSLSVRMREVVKSILLPKKNPWHEILAHYLDEIMQNDYSWARPNKRFSQSDVMIPSLFNRDVAHAVICIDASGSISNDDLKLYGSYITQLLETYPGIETTVIAHSVEPDIENIKHYSYEDLPLELNINGGGGTEIMPTIRYLDQMDSQPKFVLWFTDLGFWDNPEYHTSYPIFFLDNYHSRYDQQRYKEYGEIIEI